MAERWQVCRQWFRSINAVFRLYRMLISRKPQTKSVPWPRFPLATSQLLQPRLAIFLLRAKHAANHSLLFILCFDQSPQEDDNKIFPVGLKTARQVFSLSRQEAFSLWVAFD